jgi:hypothetical protein
VVRSRFGIALASTASCRDYQKLCAANDPSLTPEDCWNAGYDEGYSGAKNEAYNAAYDSGYAQCEEDFDAL